MSDHGHHAPKASSNSGGGGGGGIDIWPGATILGIMFGVAAAVIAALW